jgi:hypothetical protein
MRRPVQLTAALAAAIALGAALAPAASARSRHFHETIETAPIVTSPTFPAAGSTQSSAGPIHTPAFGRGGGAQLNVGRVTAVQGSTITFTVRGTDFFGAGSQRWTGTGTATLAADGSITSRGRGHYTGGNGRFRRARGRFTFTSTQVAGSPITSITSDGTVRF